MANYDASALAQAAIDARRMSYSPYSGFAVGAALLAEDGTVYTGCNIENAAYTVAVCAERTALFKAVSSGARKFTAIAVCGGPAENDGSVELPFCTPCGVCRQALYEFGGDELPVVMALGGGKTKTYPLGELLPMGFGPKDLE